MGPPDNRYMSLINCHTTEEVRKRVREWSSSLTQDQHLIRSAILDIHASVEATLKQVLYQALLPLLFDDGDEKQNVQRRSSLERMIRGLNFGTAHRILKPAFDACPADELSDLSLINEVRNQVAHGSVNKALYKARNPFADADSLAQLFFDAWALKQVLGDFYHTMIGDPRALAVHYERFYRDNYDRFAQANEQQAPPSPQEDS